MIDDLLHELGPCLDHFERLGFQGCEARIRLRGDQLRDQAQHRHDAGAAEGCAAHVSLST